ncbi:tyrosine-type recombinase/integrase [Pseudorhodobacter turbinis]|uniref:tyrosine-type recombinase/integrase n=1 Tax=Pseudorhodobacter turbinis TaxID=2500533 RepID=UPI001F0FCBCF|nr:tyrosine-type recombinase/integrase [Pseudorhodobacter turbinis]
MEQYLGGAKYRNLSDSRKRSIRGELDWLHGVAGDLPFSRLGVKHVEALMGKKSGPSAANTVKKNLSMLFNFAIKNEYGIIHNPAKYAERMKENPDGYHTWTEAEIDKFLAKFGPGTKARLACLLVLNTGASRQDLSRMGWQNVNAGRIAYRRGKTHVEADLPILDELQAELDLLPHGGMVFLCYGPKHLPYKPETLGNWFRKHCKVAGVPGSLHGLRKAGATRLADAGASPDEIRAYLAHATNQEGATYTKKADRARLADSGLAKLTGSKNEHNLSNLDAGLDITNAQHIANKGK